MDSSFFWRHLYMKKHMTKLSRSVDHDECGTLMSYAIMVESECSLINILMFYLLFFS
jgi:hypothetical protein